ncbi:unnamed protein product, partial [Rotaria sordida]
MRPKITSLKKKETAKRKNHEHYVTHKHEILAKRNIQTLELTYLQILNRNECETKDLKINEAFNYLSINETTNNTNAELFDDSDFMDKYAADIEEDGIAFEDIHENEYEEETIEDTLTEQQMEFGNEFINMEASAIPIPLKVPHVPESWYKLKQVIKRTEEAPQVEKQIIDSTSYFCPECEQESLDPNKCTNFNCSYYSNTLIPPHTFMVMNIQQQIEYILKSIDRNDLQLLAQTSTESTTSMTDIYQGRVYKNIVNSLRDEHHKFFISLTCNIDGVAVYTSSEQSMWTFTACINELNRSIRFNVEKIIVLAISVGGKKPSRLIMQKMLIPIVSRLKQLQKPILYQISDTSYQILRVYLIAISNDKPANSMVQNQSEPNALFGCSKCEIAGYTTPAKLHATPHQSAKIATTYIRIFPTTCGEQPEMRCNARWYEICHATQNGIRFLTNENKSHTYGYMGECELCNLSFIDRGSSFMSDTLHSIYHGAFLWTESSRKQSWSLSKFLPSIDRDLSKILYPTTTTRAPRSIMKCLKLKANECRILLLIGYPIFKNYLPNIYYEHLQKLAFGISIGESSNISSEKLEEMNSLLTSFVDNFPYHERYVVQTIHCVKHFATT